MPRLFLLSPAKVDGVRAGQLLSPRASFELARRFQSEGASIADLFAFASSLYFRGKIAYARRFAVKGNGDLIRVITANAGLVPPERVLKPVDLINFGRSTSTKTIRGMPSRCGATRRHWRERSAAAK